MVLMLSLPVFNLRVNAEKSEEDIVFAGPIEDGVVFMDFRYVDGLQAVSIRNPNMLGEYTEILASADGKVISMSVLPNDMYTIIIEHSSGYITKYTGLSSIEVELKDIVSASDVIGKSENNKIEFVIIKDNVRLENTKELIGLE